MEFDQNHMSTLNMNFVFMKIGFVIQKGLAVQLVIRLSFIYV